MTFTFFGRGSVMTRWVAFDVDQPQVVDNFPLEQAIQASPALEKTS